MSSAVTLRPAVVAAKQRLAAERAKLKQQHDAGSPGIQVCTLLADNLDHVVLQIYEAALAELPAETAATLRSGVSLVAHGGYGRRDVAPYSDVDLMILHSAEATPQVPLLARRMLQDLFDVGLVLGQSVRTVRDACRMGLKDPTIFTSLVESRHLAGCEGLFDRFQRKFSAAARRRWRRLVGAIEKAREQERLQFGGTVFLLEPNIKRSAGGLRGIQLLRWVGFARYGHASPDSLQLMGALTKEDQRALRAATEFLLRVRNELHFQAGKAHDVLDRAEQVRIASTFGYRESDVLLPVEEFMREYFRHTTNVRHIASRFLEGAQPWVNVGERFAPLLSHQVEGDFRVGPMRISATRRGLAKVTTDLTQVLRLADLANLYNKRIAHNTWEAVRRAAPALPDLVTEESATRFLSLLSQPAQLSELLWNLHELGALEKLIPAFGHARCLLQFNEYHKYTVDEHCLRAVRAATRFLDEPAPWGAVYRSIKQKRTLHLALLIHDLGKGHPEDHSEVGLRIAEETARRLRLGKREAETLKFLVHKHLLMSHLAFRRDTSDEEVLVRFAVEVGSPEALSMLYVLTCADLASVGPGVFNSWKGEVLDSLYRRTMRHLSGDSPSLAADERRAEVRALLSGEERARWFERQLDSLSSSYLLTSPPAQIAEELRRLAELDADQLGAWFRYLPNSQTIEYTIGAYESIAPGLFHKLTGAISSQGLEILSADINTLADGLVLDRFRVIDSDFAGRPPAERMEEIVEKLRESVTTQQSPSFRRLWRASQRRAADALQVMPTQVRVDNGTSERHTIIDVFATDRLGLLYAITRTLFELELSVSLAKIGTYLDQVVDVFYVTDRQGRKISDEPRLEHIRARLLEAIEQFEHENV